MLVIHQQDKEYLVEVISKESANSASPRQSLVSNFYGMALSTSLGEGTPLELSIQAIDLCIKDGWNNSPCWMERLLTTYNLLDLDARVHKIWEYAKHQPKKGVDPLSLNILSSSKIFINRTEFRDHVSFLDTAMSDSRPILIIHGEPKLGKSYSFEYISYFCSVRANIVPYRFALTNELGAEIGPIELAKDMVSGMRSTSPAPVAYTNNKLYIRTLAKWVLSEATNTAPNYKHWFVMDNFLGDELRSDTLNFLQELAEGLTGGMQMRQCRLIFTGFDANNLTVDPSRVEEQYVSDCKVADLKSTINEIIELAIVKPDFSVLYDYVTIGLVRGEHYMSEINSRLSMLLKATGELNKIYVLRTGLDYQQLLMAMVDKLPAGRAAFTELTKRLYLLKTTIETSA